MVYCEAGCLKSGAVGECGGGACLVEAARAGDSQARERLFTLVAPVAQAQARRVSGEWALAQDIAQAALLHALEHLGELRRADRLGAWVRRIVTNESRMEARRRASRPQMVEEGCARATLPCDGDRRLDARRALRRVVEAAPQLPPLLEQTFRMRVVEGLTTRQTAEKLGVSEEAVRARLSRARKRLRRGASRDCGR